MAEERHESDAGITSYAEAQPGNHDVEDCAVELEQEDRKTGKKEEEGTMDKYRYNSGYPLKVKLLEALRVESTNASSVLRTMSSLSRLEVGLSPLWYKYRKESPGETHGQTQKPDGVNKDCGFRWRKFRWIRRDGLDEGLGASSIGE